MFATAALDAAVDGITGSITHLGLHSSFSTTGANELSGGSPAYARKPVTWNAAASRIGDNTGAISFDVPAGATVEWVGFWSALTAGTFLGMCPVGSTTVLPASANAADNTIYAPGHGFTNGDRVALTTIDGGAMPGGLTEGVLYYVVAATTDSFQVAATSGGAAIALTSSADVLASNAVPETFGAQGTLQISAGALDVIGLA